MISPQKTQHSLSKYSMTTNEKTQREKSFISNFCSQYQLKSYKSKSKKHIGKITNKLSPNSRNKTNELSECKIMRATAKSPHRLNHINSDKRIKYSFVPNIAKMKHLDSNIIDSVLTYNSELFHTISSNKDQKSVEVKRCRNVKRTMQRSRNRQPTKAIEQFNFEEINRLQSLTITESELSPSYIPTIFFRPSKIVLANINESKKDDLLFSRNMNKLDTLLALPSAKKASLLDRLIIKVNNPIDCIEDHNLSQRPGDIYKRFKGQLVRTKDHIDKLVIDIQRNYNMNKNLLKIYSGRLRSKPKH